MSDILGFFDADQYCGYMDIQEFFKKADHLFFHHTGKQLYHLQKTIKGFGQGTIY